MAGIFQPAKECPKRKQEVIERVRAESPETCVPECAHACMVWHYIEKDPAFQITVRVGQRRGSKAKILQNLSALCNLLHFLDSNLRNYFMIESQKVNLINSSPLLIFPPLEQSLYFDYSVVKRLAKETEKEETTPSTPEAIKSSSIPWDE